MKKEIRTICYDEELGMEVFRFQGIMQPFPKHFHEYYVIGIMECGNRYLQCGSQEHLVGERDILLFNPGDSHACSQCGEEKLSYRGFNVSVERMKKIIFDLTENERLLRFKETVIHDRALAGSLCRLHRMIMAGGGEFEKEELFLFAFSQLIGEYGEPFEAILPECGTAIEAACEYMKTHYSERITLDRLCGLTALSKATLIRSFTKIKGITPYRYLENLRLSEAKKLLEQGETPINSAIKAGFSDQSHFTNFFKEYIGLTPKQYADIFKEDE